MSGRGPRRRPFRCGRTLQGVTLAREDWKHWAQSGKAAWFLDERLWVDDGPVRLKVQKRSFA